MLTRRSLIQAASALLAARALRAAPLASPPAPVEPLEAPAVIPSFDDFLAANPGPWPIVSEQAEWSTRYHGVPVYTDPHISGGHLLFVDSSFHNAMLDHWSPHLSAARDAYGPLAPARAGEHAHLDRV